MKSSCRYFSQLVSRLMSSLSSLKRKCGNQQKKKETLSQFTNHSNQNKTASRVGFLGSSIPSRKPCQKPHLVHESFDGPRHAPGREPGWAWRGGEGTIHCYHEPSQARGLAAQNTNDWKISNTNVLLCSLHVATAQPGAVNLVSIYAKLVFIFKNRLDLFQKLQFYFPRGLKSECLNLECVL